VIDSAVSLTHSFTYPCVRSQVPSQFDGGSQGLLSELLQMLWHSPSSSRMKQ